MSRPPAHRAAAPTLETLTTAVTCLGQDVDTLRVAAEVGADVATRLDTVEHDLAHCLARLETVAEIAALGQPAAAAGPSRTGYQFPSAVDWVDDVFARLAARHQARWCPRWETHLEAQARLQLMWHTWEAAHTEPANHTARDEWLRVIFDHHTPWLLNREGPFAGCTPQLCAVAPALPQRTADPTARMAQVTQLGAYRRSSAMGAR